MTIRRSPITVNPRVPAHIAINRLSAIAPLGPLDALKGTFITRPDTTGFNTIFRPNAVALTALPLPDKNPTNILELNLTNETLVFSTPIGTVPNRGSVQPDIFLNGVSYLQTVTDVTRFTLSKNPTDKVGIHVEPGLWMNVPATTVPAGGATVVRMASIPHGTTICAQGTASTVAGPPDIPDIDISPTGGAVPSQTASNANTDRIPQDLNPYHDTITQDMLDNPNIVLKNAISGQTITSTTALSVAAAAPALAVPTDGVPQGGGVDNIDFLLGDAHHLLLNGFVVSMQATFWIETVEYSLRVPGFTPGQPPLQLKPEHVDPASAPTFLIDSPVAINEPRGVIAQSTQIQYSQLVVLSFMGLKWPHVSVATLIPEDPVPVPVSALSSDHT